MGGVYDFINRFPACPIFRAYPIKVYMINALCVSVNISEGRTMNLRAEPGPYEACFSSA
jgi:hypothetical protein